MPGEKLTAAEIKRRTDIAKMEQLELAVQKERLALADKERALCRIDLALEEFDKFLADFVTLLKNIPDTIQTIDPTLSPAQYKQIQDLIDSQIQRMGQKRLRLELESTRSEKEAATEIKNESIRKAAKIKGGGK
jgi:hypothetical protein